MNIWLVEIIGGIALILVSIVPALIFTSFVSTFWAPFTITFALGAALVFSGYFRGKFHDSTPLRVSSNGELTDKNK
ncbi:MAG: hypothetical protein ACP5UZ_07675 [Thermoplasmata archaeon]